MLNLQRRLARIASFADGDAPGLPIGTAAAPSPRPDFFADVCANVSPGNHRLSTQCAVPADGNSAEADTQRKQYAYPIQLRTLNPWKY